MVTPAPISVKGPDTWSAPRTRKAPTPSLALPVKSICAWPLVMAKRLMAGDEPGVLALFQDREKLSMPKVAREPEPVAGESATILIQRLDEALLAFVPRL